MTMIPVPAWLVLVFLVLLAVREYFTWQRDAAAAELWAMYLRERDALDRLASLVEDINSELASLPPRARGASPRETP